MLLLNLQKQKIPKNAQGFSCNAAIAEAKPRSNLTIICQKHDMIHFNGQQWSELCRGEDIEDCVGASPQMPNRLSLLTKYRKQVFYCLVFCLTKIVILEIDF
jgi:hypothetical protein